MNDKNFKRSIILICEHGRDGSFGYKLNDKVDYEYLEINVDKKIKIICTMVDQSIILF